MKKIILMMIMVVMMIGTAYSAPTFITPADGGTIRGASQMFNITTLLKNAVKNCTITLSSAKTGDSLTIIAWNTTLVDSTRSNITTTNSTYTLHDSNDYAVTASCTNLSMESESATSITVTVDNSRPICEWSNPTSGGSSYDADITWKINGKNATSATVTFGSNPAISMSEGYYDDIFSLAGSTDLIPLGTYSTVSAWITDGTNTTTCALSEIKVEDSDSTLLAAGGAVSELAKKQADAAAEEVTVTQSTNSNKTMMYGIIAIVGAYLLLGRKKK